MPRRLQCFRHLFRRQLRIVELSIEAICHGIVFLPTHFIQLIPGQSGVCRARMDGRPRSGPGTQDIGDLSDEIAGRIGITFNRYRRRN